MNATSLGIALRGFATVAMLLVLAPAARGPAVDAALVADQAPGKQPGAAIVLAQGRCFNGRCF